MREIAQNAWMAREWKGKIQEEEEEKERNEKGKTKKSIRV